MPQGRRLGMLLNLEKSKTIEDVKRDLAWHLEDAAKNDGVSYWRSPVDVGGRPAQPINYFLQNGNYGPQPVPISHHVGNNWPQVGTCEIFDHVGPVANGGKQEIEAWGHEVHDDGIENGEVYVWRIRNIVITNTDYAKSA